MFQRYLKFGYTIFLILIFLYPLTQEPLEKKIGSLSVPTIIAKTSELKDKAIPKAKSISHYGQAEIVSGLQQARKQIDLAEFEIDSAMCSAAETIFHTLEVQAELSTEDLQIFCPNCSKKAYYSIEGNYKIPSETAWFQINQAQQLISQNYSHLCVYADDQKALLLLGDVNSQTQSNAKNKSISSDIPIYNFTESQLWQAFVDYRHAHTKPDILLSESLCQYARERVAEHVNLFESKAKEEYQNQDKYPLDAHAGFMRDGDSGYVFEKTGFNVVAENLAYWPSAQYPHQVFEWGWDTSTEGHREAQLSDEYTHACISGQEGFYVAIFGRN